MNDEILEYKCATCSVPSDIKVLNTNDSNGIICTFSGGMVPGTQQSKFSWIFDWNELKNSGVDSLHGQIGIRFPAYEHSESQPYMFDVELTHPKQLIEKAFNCQKRLVAFEYRLFSVYNSVEDVLVDEMFAQSSQTDSILVVEGKKLHVNKAFLSLHSDFFRSLFSSNFKEGKMDEIPVEDVTVNELGLLLSTIYPKTVFPNDKTVEKLLFLADRFIMPSVIGHVEYQLLHNSRIGNEKLISMADKYGLMKLFDKSVRQMNTIEKAKNLKKSSNYPELSERAKAKLFDRILQII